MSALVFADHMHDLVAGDQHSGAKKFLEAEYRLHDPFGRAVVLPGGIQVFGLARLDERAAVGLNAHDNGCLGAALVGGDPLGRAMHIADLLEK